MKNKNIIKILVLVLAITGCIFITRFAFFQSSSSKNASGKVERQSSLMNKKSIPNNMIEIPDISHKNKEEADVLLKQAGVKVKYVTGDFSNEINEYTTSIPKNTVDYDEYQPSVTLYFSKDGWDIGESPQAPYVNKSSTLVVRVADKDYKYSETSNETNSSEFSPDTSSKDSQATILYNEGNLKLEQTNWNTFKFTNNSADEIMVSVDSIDIDGQEINSLSFGLDYMSAKPGEEILGALTDYDNSNLLKEGKTIHFIINFVIFNGKNSNNENFTKVGNTEFNIQLKHTVNK